MLLVDVPPEHRQALEALAAKFQRLNVFIDPDLDREELSALLALATRVYREHFPVSASGRPVRGTGKERIAAAVSIEEQAAVEPLVSVSWYYDRLTEARRRSATEQISLAARLLWTVRAWDAALALLAAMLLRRTSTPAATAALQA